MRFSLKTLLIALTLVAVLCALPISRALRQKAAKQRLQQMQASVWYSDSNRDGIPDYSPDAIQDSLLTFVFGPDLFYDIDQVFFTSNVDDFSPLRALPKVHGIHLWGPFFSGKLDVETLEKLPGLKTIEIISDTPGFSLLDVDAIRQRLPGVTVEVRNAYAIQQ